MIRVYHECYKNGRGRITWRIFLYGIPNVLPAKKPNSGWMNTTSIIKRAILSRITPTQEELREWVSQSGLDIKRFFNASGLLYKSMQLKEKLPQMELEEKLALLATDGMLVKRPLVIGQGHVLVGFKPHEWESLL